METDLEIEERNTEKVPFWTSCRWTMALVGFVGFFCVYAVRTNMSVAIVCMVKPPNTTHTNDTSDDCPKDDAEAASSSGEFDWDKNTQGLVNSAFFYGYIVTQIPGGWMSDKYGGKYVMGIGVFLSGVATLFCPLAARGHYGALIAMRILIGIATGCTFPAVHGMWGSWAPTLERTVLTTVCYSGLKIGNIITFMFSGMLCGVEYDKGWPLIFYIPGGFTLCWCIVWFILVHNSPADHPRITKIEKEYIQNNVGDGALKDRTQNNLCTGVPWLSFFTSGPQWSINIVHMCNNYTGYTLLTNLPTYMKDVLKFDIKSNGFLTALPYMVQFCASLVAGRSADIIRQRWLSTTVTRKIFQSTGLIVPGIFLLCTGLLNCHQRAAAIAMLSLAVGFQSANDAAYMVNHIDIAPK